MLHIVWGLLNIGLFILFLFICFKATKQVREKLGFLASLIFVFGLLSFMSEAGNDSANRDPEKSNTREWKFTPADKISSSHRGDINVLLEKSVLSTVKLVITHGEENETRLKVPVSAYSTATGFSSGTYWKPVAIIVDFNPSLRKFEYSVSGIVEWKLLGTTIYSQAKKYAGLAEIR